MAPFPMGVLENARCVFVSCVNNNVPSSPQFASYPCPDSGFAQYGCDISGNKLNDKGEPVKPLMARAMDYTIKSLKHGHDKNWGFAAILAGTVLSLMMLGFIILCLRARIRIAKKNRFQRTVKDKVVGENKGSRVWAVEEEGEYGDFI